MSKNNIFNKIVALRNEKGSYNKSNKPAISFTIVALRNEKGSYNHWLSNKANQ